MAMEITNGYSSYTASYADTGKANGKKTDGKKAENTSAQETTAGTNNTSSAVSAGMSYLQNLQKAYSSASFMVGTVSYGQTYGNSSDINFVVNPSYVSKLGTDSEAQSQFEKDVEYLYNFSQNRRKQQAANGWEVISEGWFCDENGNWGGWCAVRKTDEKSFFQKMQEKSDKIMEEKREKRQELKELDEKREAAKAEKTELKVQIEKQLKERFGDRWKGVVVIHKDDETAAVPKSDKDHAEIAGLNMDIKA